MYTAEEGVVNKCFCCWHHNIVGHLRCRARRPRGIFHCSPCALCWFFSPHRKHAYQCIIINWALIPSLAASVWAIWVTLWPRAVVIHLEFIFLITAASVGALIDVLPLAVMFNGHRPPRRATVQPLPGVTVSAMSQRRVRVLLYDFALALNDGDCDFSESSYVIPTARTLRNIPALFQWNPSGFMAALQGYLWTDALSCQVYFSI